MDIFWNCTFLLFSFLECTDTRNDLKLEGEWKSENSISEEFEERFPGPSR